MSLSSPASSTSALSSPASSSTDLSRRFAALVVLIGAAVVGALLVLGGGAAAEPTEPRAPYVPHDKTIVKVTGDKWNGFGIHRYDGTADYPPTSSEAKAECSEYSTRLERVRCRTQVRVWYRDLGDMKRSINYYRAQLED